MRMKFFFLSFLPFSLCTHFSFIHSLPCHDDEGGWWWKKKGKFDGNIFGVASTRPDVTALKIRRWEIQDAWNKKFINQMLTLNLAHFTLLFTFLIHKFAWVERRNQFFLCSFFFAFLVSMHSFTDAWFFHPLENCIIWKPCRAVNSKRKKIRRNRREVKKISFKALDLIWVHH